MVEKINDQKKVVQSHKEMARKPKVEKKQGSNKIWFLLCQK